jgi:biotin synthase-related radical SAM superfamily protein
VAPGKAATGIDGYYRAWERAVEVFGRGRVSTYVILGMGEDRALTEEGCRRAIEMGVYPFVVPLRPVPGTLMADARPPAPDYVASIYRAVSAMLADAGFDHADAGAGCARCQACSGLSAWERVFEKERWRELAGRRAS